MSQLRSRTVGVLGGLGPLATLDFYGKLLSKTNASSDQEHLQVFIHSNPQVPDRQASIAGTGPSCVPALVKSARALERSGADFLVMVCNTAHAYEDVIDAATTIPFVSIIAASVAACRRRAPEVKSVGLLASDGCLSADLYQRAFAAHGIEVVTPDPAGQALLMELVFKIKANDHDPALKTAMIRLAESLIDRGADVVLAACTEIPLVLDEDALRKTLINSTDALVDATIAFSQRRKWVSPASESVTKPKTATTAGSEQQRRPAPAAGSGGRAGAAD